MRTMSKLTAKEREQIAELEGMESWLQLQAEVSNEEKAKHYACLGHDWLVLDFEDRAIKLFVKAEKTCPGYFRLFFVPHAKESPKFALLAVKIAALLINLEVQGGGLNH
jgi:hypothetical protein